MDAVEEVGADKKFGDGNMNSSGGSTTSATGVFAQIIKCVGLSP